MQKIGVIVAMEEELSPVLGKLGSAEIVCHHPYFVKKIALGSSELYLVKSGVGEISAAGAAQFLLTAYGCEALWNFGVVGGLTDEMDFNRVVLVDRVVHYAFDTSAIASPRDACVAFRRLIDSALTWKGATMARAI